jgi:N-acetylneuraminic acid mutarotase
MRLMVNPSKISLLLLWLIVALFVGLEANSQSAFAGNEPRDSIHRVLTIKERIDYQKAIEEVYWRHRIWPKENPSPKPSLDAVTLQGAAEKKVRDYLRESQALEDYWQRPLTAGQLQAEMDRMARDTKQPEVLNELFEALGNDSFVIAECLARPALAERLLSSWYAYDQLIHGELKQRVEAGLRVHTTIEQLKQLGGEYSEIEFVKSESGENLQNNAITHGSTKLTTGEWDATVDKVATMFSNYGNTATERRGYNAAETYKTIPIGKPSRLQEDETRFFVIAVVEKTANDFKLVMVTWSKESLESWLTKTENEVREPTVTGGAAHVLPSISIEVDPCDNAWTPTALPSTGRAGHSAVWTGSEMIVWGGAVGFGVVSNTGGRYTPSTNSWAATGTVNAPSVRSTQTAVWTGSEMIVWGGAGDPDAYLNTGGRYNPATDSWTATNTSNAPHARISHTAVWTGREMIVWGGYYQEPPATDHYVSTGGRYNPSADSWIATTTVNAPAGRSIHTSIWTGNEMIVWGGAIANSQWVNTGGRYNAATDNWTPISIVNAPAARAYHTGIWTGSEMIVWGGATFSSWTATGGRYNPSTDSWNATSITNAPVRRYAHAVVWTGNEMIMWGGYGCDQSCSSNYPDTGGRYSPSTNSWVATSMTNSPSPRAYPTAVWTGREMIVWGGDFFDGSNHYLNTGGRYCAQPSAPMVQKAVSRKAHGNAGTFDINLPLTGTPGVECRTGGATGDYTIVVTFLANVSVSGNPQASVTSGIGSIGSGGVVDGGRVTIAENVATIPLTNVANAQTISVTLNNVNGSTNVTIPMRILVGDVNGNGTVNASDITQTKTNSGVSVDATNFRSDINANGSVNASDVTLVKSNSGTGLRPSHL